MADIPDDILRAAGDAILKVGKAYRVGGAFHLAIAQAIAAERERNRMIARNRVDDLHACLNQPLSDEAKGSFGAMLTEALLIEDRIDDTRSAVSEMKRGAA
jgi:hypothetical protein